MTPDFRTIADFRRMNLKSIRMACRQLRVSEDAGIPTYLPKVKTSANEKLGLYTKEDFRYNELS